MVLISYIEDEMGKLLRDILTGKDNQTYDHIKVYSPFCLVGIFAIVFIEVFHGQHVDILKVAESIGIIVGTSAVGVKVKETTEPDATNQASNDLKGDNNAK